MEIVLLASGGLGATLLKNIYSKFGVVAVFTDRKSKEIIEFCHEKVVDVFVGNPRKGNATLFIEHLNCDVLLSVNYLFIIEEDLIRLPKKIAINVHGSLLPKYRGRTPHVWSIINGEKEAGITAHQLVKEMDAGAILGQKVIEITPEMTGAKLLTLYHEFYPGLIDKVLNAVLEDRVVANKQDHSLATYFPKRTPEDGAIDWSWSKERIKNWVRAQAPPYPGAFCYLNGRKLQVNQVIFTDRGFHHEQANGLIIDKTSAGLWVKTTNGVVLLKVVLDSLTNFDQVTGQKLI